MGGPFVTAPLTVLNDFYHERLEWWTGWCRRTNRRANDLTIGFRLCLGYVPARPLW